MEDSERETARLKKVIRVAVGREDGRSEFRITGVVSTTDSFSALSIGGDSIIESSDVSHRIDA